LPLSQHTGIECLNFSGNEITDKYSLYFKKIISAHTERRNELIWMYSLRGDVPDFETKFKGLISLDLSHNNIGDLFMEEILHALNYDAYLFKLDFSYNNIQKNIFKSIGKMINTNDTIVNIDFR
jgi:hypothetical protein